MVDPAQEGLAYLRNIRAGIMTQSEAIRERGYDPEKFFAEYAANNKTLDRLGIVLDSDPRRMTQAGQAQAVPPTPPEPTETNDNQPGGDDDAAVNGERIRIQ